MKRWGELCPRTLALGRDGDNERENWPEKILTLKSKPRPTSLKLLRIINPSETLKSRCALPRKTSLAIKLYVEFQSDPGPLEAHPWILRESDPRLRISCRRKKSLQTDRADVRKDLETNASGSDAESGHQIPEEALWGTARPCHEVCIQKWSPLWIQSYMNT